MTKKTLYKIIAAFLVVSAMAAAACGSAPRSETETRMGQSKSENQGLPSGYALRDISVSVPLTERSAKPQLDIFLTLLAVKEPAPAARFLRELLYSGSDAEQYQNGLITEYRNLYQQNPPLEITDSVPSADWEYQEVIVVQGMGKHGLVLGKEKDIYTGGAHGMYSKIYYVIDREELKLLKLSDFFGETNEAELRGLVMEELRRYSRLEAGQPLSKGIFFEDEPEMSSNFFVTEEGLGLHWDQYEIAPYSEGYIEIILPWKTVRPLLKQEIMERLTKFGIYLFVS
jgi:hypothetical protein